MSFLGIFGIPAKNLSLFSFESISSLKSEKSSLKGGFETIKSNFLRLCQSLKYGSLIVFHWTTLWIEWTKLFKIRFNLNKCDDLSDWSCE